MKPEQITVDLEDAEKMEEPPFGVEPEEVDTESQEKVNS